MKLGEMLVRDGRLSAAQLESAIEDQGKRGGRLGSILVENKLIDAETLTVYLGLELGIPIATGGTLERCKRSAVELLTPSQASEFVAIPIVIQGRSLLVAMDNPHDLEALDGIAQATGYRVIPKVAPEIRVHYYLERYYGVKRDSRYATLGDSPRGSRSELPEHKDLPAPPLPGLPPKTAIQSEKNPKKIEIQKAARRRARATEELAEKAANLIHELETNVDDEALVVEESQLYQEGEKETTRDSRGQSISLDDALSAIEAAKTRSEVADAILDCCRSSFDAAALLLVRDNMAFGWKGYGPKIEDDRIETLLIPLDAPSIFQKAISNNHQFCGHAFRASLHTYLFRVLRTKPPTSIAVSGIVIGKRVVNLLYVHSSRADITSAEQSKLEKLTTTASAAYVRMIADTGTNEE